MMYQFRVPEPEQVNGAEEQIYRLIGWSSNIPEPLALNQLKCTALLKQVEVGSCYQIDAGRIALNRGQTFNIRNLARVLIRDYADNLRAQMAMQSIPENGLDARHEDLIYQLRSVSSDDFDDLYLSQLRLVHEEALTLMQELLRIEALAGLWKLALARTDLIQRKLAIITALRGKGPYPFIRPNYCPDTV